MANIQASGAQGNISIDNLKVTTPDIINYIAVNADTEYNISLPSNTTRFLVRARGTAKLRLAFNSGETATKYITLWPGYEYIDADIDLVSLTLYIQSSKAGETIEIVSWV